MTADPLLDEIVAHPDDDTPRLVWADREGGERGELVVVQCELARPDLPRERRRALVARERELLRNAARWAGLGLDEHGEVRFERGFVDALAIDLDALVARGGELFERAPLLRELEIREMSGQVNAFAGPRPDEDWAAKARLLATAFAALPPGRVRSLVAKPTVWESGDWASPSQVFAYNDAFTELVASTPPLRELEELVMRGGQIGPAAIAQLARLPRLQRLEASFRLDAAGFASLLAALPQLARLAARDNSPALRGPQLAAFLADPQIARLRELDLRGNQLAEADLIRISTTPALAKLERLGLGQAPARYGVEAIAVSPHLANVVELDLDVMGGVYIGLLGSATFADRLRRLSLGYARFVTGDVDTLLGMPALEQLDLVAAQISDADRAELAAAIPSVT